ncbi:protocatechuate 3,4-dioxygenase subunit alpha [Mycobacterium asiaticum]|uniref:Protocatechuate 3,4-dioxygenase subunit alpha n=1 Tax=Mycobacterium asiaticum TaxID=1790 RepID=A0A1A3KPR8_MYCAS|nr:protocatechuate 3,4-dioxygenase subunit alpha [Mycobacterium asiaticum]OBJ87010.1 protocatechuate 3,4-dioxygenase subunit alpha [Mycobacterium asiaticum]
MPSPELVCTPAQTVGPFFGLGLPFPGDSALVAANVCGAVELHGAVYDGAGVTVPDALVEIWQPDTAGRIPRVPGSLRRDGRTFTGWGRAATDTDGHYRISTVPPGPVNPGRPAYFAVTVFARGLLQGLFTRAYLPGGDIGADPLLSTLDPSRRDTLLCSAESDSGRTRYRFDIHLQGPDETVFLAYRDGRR